MLVGENNKQSCKMFRIRRIIIHLYRYRRKKTLFLAAVLIYLIHWWITPPGILDHAIISDPRGTGLCSGCCPSLTRESYREQTVDNMDTFQGGHVKPTNCKVRERVAVIVPYRNREKHLEKFLEYMHPFLRAQQLEYVIYIVELALPTTFNRGLLVNIGISLAMNSGIGFSCYVIHDVDLLPVDDRNLYVCSESPRHMSSLNSKYNGSMPYEDYAGGVISLSFLQLININGFSNLYFGWGGEDDDLRKRIYLRGYKLHRVPYDIGRYTALYHDEDDKNPVNPDRYNILQQAYSRIRHDGLNSLRYKLLKLEKRTLYTWIYVQVNETDYSASSILSFKFSNLLLTFICLEVIKSVMLDVS